MSEKLEKLDKIRSEYEDLDKMVSDLEHYTTKTDANGYGSLRKKTKRLFPLFEFLFTSKESVIVKPHTIYSSVDISPRTFSSEEMNTAMSNIQHELLEIALERLSVLKLKRKDELDELLS